MNERDFPHLVELAFPPGGFRNRALSSTHSTTSATLPFAAAEVGTKRSSSMCAFTAGGVPAPYGVTAVARIWANCCHYETAGEAHKE